MQTPMQQLALAKLFSYLRKPWRKPTWRRKAVSGNLDARDRQAWRNDVSSPYLRQRSAWAYSPNQFTSQIALTPVADPRSSRRHHSPRSGCPARRQASEQRRSVPKDNYCKAEKHPALARKRP